MVYCQMVYCQGELMLLEATTTQTILREISADLETPISVYMKLRG